jgi:hypothetical protein
LRDLEIDAVDGLDGALELPLKPDDLDCRDAAMLLHAQLLSGGADATPTG